MWLINTTTLGLEYFAVPERARRYAVLSHTWGNEELTFAEFRSLTGTNSDSLKDTRGYQKIRKTCELARQSNIPYVWVDTCCIDKSSSAELTEAINSMYNYYRRSDICYAYIDDWMPDQDWCDLVALGEEVPTPTPRKSSGNHSTGKPGRPHCPLRWFTRGWTLQELIAPSRVQFYDASWLSRGFKNDDDIMPHLSRITGITPRVLENGGEMSLKSVCLGQRMSWAAHRETSRVEDTAYCLMGIFQVNMPLLYGEGNRAFLRFQHEIIKNMTDLSIFAWEPGEATAFSGIFASHPHQFARLGTCELSRSQFSQGSEIAITNKGVRIYTAPFRQGGERAESSSLLYLDLGCMTKSVGAMNSRFLLLYALSEGVYARSCFASPTESDLHSMVRVKARALYIVQDEARARYHYNTTSWVYINIPAELNENGTNGESYRLQRSGSWPPSHMAKQMSENLTAANVTNMSWFMGYMKLNIVAQAGHEETAVVDEIVVVYLGGVSEDQIEVTAGLLERGPAVDFVDFVQRAEELHPQVAQETLSSHLLELRDRSVLREHLIIRDAARGKDLQISAISSEPARTSVLVDVAIKEVPVVTSRRL